MRLKKQGIALISVLFIAVAVMILALTFSRMVVSETQAAGSSRTMNASLQVADGVSERARARIVDEFQKSYKTVGKFLEAVDNGTLASLNDTDVYSETVGTTTGYWQVKRLNYTDTQAPWIEIAATAKTPKGVQTVVRRIGMGQSAIFELAMLSERTDCMYCHLRVRGDVGQLHHMRPGWGDELHGAEPANGWEDGWGSGDTSKVYGSAYAARTITQDDLSLGGSTKTINGAEFDEVYTNYKGDKLPQDQDGDDIPDFPAIDRNVAESSADGSLSGGIIYKVNRGGSLLSVPSTSNLATLNDTFDGNVVLEGTASNPIDLSGDVYISGDVIIKGYVKGQGAIYAGRNVYVAGDIKYVDENSDCWAASDPDLCAQQDIAADKTELRLAARGNIVIGDYTEKKADGTDKPWSGLQSADYYRSQFGFYSGTKYYDKATGDELSCNTSGATVACKNVDGEVITNYKAVDGKTAYDYSLRPGEIKNDGSFDSWLDDGTYQKILGKETRPYNTWRYDVTNAGKTRASLTRQDLKDQFTDYNVSDASLDAMLCASGSCTNGSYTIQDTSGNDIGVVHWDGDQLRVIMDPPVAVDKQVTRVDAFLYANQRIAGKTFMAPMVVNGGLIAKDIGILAPGLQYKEWWMTSKYNFLENIDCTDQSSTDTHNLTDAAYEPDADDCALTINYDYRMRNGGLGFNLVEGSIGQTIGWQVAAKRSDHVTGP